MPAGFVPLKLVDFWRAVRACSSFCLMVLLNYSHSWRAVRTVRTKDSLESSMRCSVNMLAMLWCVLTGLCFEFNYNWAVPLLMKL